MNVIFCLSKVTPKPLLKTFSLRVFCFRVNPLAELGLRTKLFTIYIPLTIYICGYSPYIWPYSYIFTIYIWLDSPFLAVGAGRKKQGAGEWDAWWKSGKKIEQISFFKEKKYIFFGWFPTLHILPLRNNHHLASNFENQTFRLNQYQLQIPRFCFVFQ